MISYQEMLENAYFSHLFCNFWPKIVFWAGNAFWAQNCLLGSKTQKCPQHAFLDQNARLLDSILALMFQLFSKNHNENANLTRHLQKSASRPRWGAHFRFSRIFILSQSTCTSFLSFSKMCFPPSVGSTFLLFYRLPQLHKTNANRNRLHFLRF